MHRQEEEYPVQKVITQEETPPSAAKQVIIALSFIGFLLGLPAIIEKLGK
jgi:hypothetical protein